MWLEKASEPGQPVSVILPGQSFDIVVTVKNIGQETAYGFYLDAYYDGDYGRGGPDDIAPGEVQEWYVGPLTAESGTHITKWVVDPDNQIAELDELNNQKEYVFTFGSTTVTTTVTSSSTSFTEQSTLTTTTTTVTSTSYTTSSFRTVNPTLSLNPASGPIGTGVSASGSDFLGTTCLLSAVPASLFTSQACSIVAGMLTGSFIVDSSASAGDYTVTAQTDGGPSDSATATFTVVPTYVVTFLTDLASGTTTFDGVTKTNGTMGAYPSGSRVHVVANPPDGFSFASWEVNGVTIDSQLSGDTYVTVSNNGWLKAHFAPIQYSVTFYVDPVLSTMTCDGVTKTNGVTNTYSAGQLVHVVAISSSTSSPAPQFRFSHWEASGVSVDSATSEDTYMTVSGNGWLKAYFTTEPRLCGGDSECVPPDVTGEPEPARLIVIERVVNDDGGTASASDFWITVTGEGQSLPPFQGSESGATVTLTAGSYNISVTGPDGYGAAVTGDCSLDASVTLEVGDVKTCTITENDLSVGQNQSPEPAVGGELYPANKTALVSPYVALLVSVTVIAGVSAARRKRRPQKC